MLLKHSYNGVEVLSLDKEELKRQLRKVAQKIKLDHPEVREMIVFGSFLKDNYTPYSDIDVAIVVEKSKKKFIGGGVFYECTPITRPRSPLYVLSARREAVVV